MRNRYVLLALDFIKQIMEIIYKFKCAARLVLICFCHVLAPRCKITFSISNLIKNISNPA